MGSRHQDRIRNARGSLGGTLLEIKWVEETEEAFIPWGTFDNSARKDQARRLPDSFKSLARLIEELQSSSSSLKESHVPQTWVSTDALPCTILVYQKASESVALVWTLGWFHEGTIRVVGQLCFLWPLLSMENEQHASTVAQGTSRPTQETVFPGVGKQLLHGSIGRPSMRIQKTKSTKINYDPYGYSWLWVCKCFHSLHLLLSFLNFLYLSPHLSRTWWLL